MQLKKKTYTFIILFILLCSGIISYFIFSKDTPNIENEKEPVATIEKKPDASQLLNEIDNISEDSVENYLSQEEHEHDGQIAGKTELDSVEKYNNFSFSKPTENDVFDSSEFNNFGLSVKFSYNDFSLVSDGDYKLYLLNNSNNEVSLISNNFYAIKPKSNSEVIFSVEISENLYSIYYLDLKSDSPIAYEIIKTIIVPYSNSFTFNDSHFVYKSGKNEFTIIPYSIYSNRFILDTSSPSDKISMLSVFEITNELYGYSTTGKAIKLILENNGYYSHYVAPFKTIYFEEHEHFVIGGQYNPLKNDLFYIAAPFAEGEYGTFVYKNKDYPNINSVNATWLDNENIISTTLNDTLIVFNTKTLKESVIVPNAYHYYIDKESNKIYYTSYYSPNLLYIEYSF